MYHLVYPISQTQYEQFANAYPMSPLLQSYAWANVKANWKAIHLGIADENQKIVAVCLLLLRPLPLGFTFGYCPHGPLADIHNKELMEFLVTAIKKIAKKNRCLFVRIDPLLIYHKFLVTDKNKRALPNDDLISTLQSYGFKHQGLTSDMHDTIQPRFIATSFLKDDKTYPLPNKILSEVARADKFAVQVESGQDELLDDFVAMLNATEERKKINFRSKDYYQLILKTFPNKAIIDLATINPKKLYQELTAEIEQLEQQIVEIKDISPKKYRRLIEQKNSLAKNLAIISPYQAEERKVISALLGIQVADGMEMLYGGTDIEFSRFFPYQKIYYTCFMRAKELNLSYFHMGGVENSLQDGLLTFKANFNPYIIEKPGEFDLVTSPLYPLMQMALRIRWKIKRKS